MIDTAVAKLADYAVRNGLIESCDYTWAINGMPSALSAASPSETLTEIIGRVSQTGELPDTELFATIAATMARTAAINASCNMSEAETDMLVADLFKTSSPNFTPGGLPIVMTIGIDEISRLFN